MVEGTNVQRQIPKELVNPTISISLYFVSVFFSLSVYLSTFFPNCFSSPQLFHENFSSFLYSQPVFSDQHFSPFLDAPQIELGFRERAGKSSSSDQFDNGQSTSGSSSDGSGIKVGENGRRMTEDSNTKVVREGDEVMLDCRINSNPPVSQIHWILNNNVENPLLTDPMKGIIISNSTLIIKYVRRMHKGHFKCIASNTEGRGQSNEVALSVLRKFFSSLFLSTSVRIFFSSLLLLLHYFSLSLSRSIFVPILSNSLCRPSGHIFIPFFLNSSLPTPRHVC